MLSYGRIHCDALARTDLSFDQKLSNTYYDAQWVYLQIAEYTGDTSWRECAQRARAIYRDGYVLPNRGFVPGYWNFPIGTALDYLQTGDALSKQATVELSRNAAYSRDSTPALETITTEASRETAYALLAHLSAEDVGEPRRARTALLVEHALGHMNSWFNVQHSARSFMVALTTHALLNYYERSGDPRVPPAILNGLTKLWELNWVPEAEAFRYQTTGTAEEVAPAPDLNLLIAPAYAWAYSFTGDPTYLTRGDAIFSGGTRRAYLGSAKQFNQNYRWSFEYLRWRNN